MLSLWGKCDNLREKIIDLHPKGKCDTTFTYSFSFALLLPMDTESTPLFSFT